MKHSLVQNLVALGAAAFVAAVMVVGPSHWTIVGAASPDFPGFTPGNLIVTRSVYPSPAPIITAGQELAGASYATAFASAGTATGGTVLDSSAKADGLTVGTLVQITTSADGTTTTVQIKSVTGGNLTWSPALANAPAANDRLFVPAYAVTTGTYPDVWDNDSVDPSFGVTTPIFLDQLTPAGAPVNTLMIDPTQIVTSFSSKSELSLNLSTDRTALTFMGYLTGVGTLDASNANTPSPIDPTNLVGGLPVPRGIAQVGPTGSLQVTPVNAYSGNNGRAVILAGGTYYMAGNAGNSGTGETGTTLSMLSDNTGMQMIAAGASGNTTVVGQVQGVYGATKGYQRGFSVTELGVAADKTGKDDNFRGLTIFNNTPYVSKGSGSNGVNTVYQVGTGSLPTAATAATTPIAILPGFPTNLAKPCPPGCRYPFGIWFANASTMYVADEGDGTMVDAPTDPGAGLQKWVLNGTSWELVYTLQKGLNLGTRYAVVNGPNGEVYPASLYPAPDGLRNLTGRVNADGTVSLWAITSTVSTNGDQGADPNQLVFITDTLTNTDSTVAQAEQFRVLQTAGYGEVLRGVSFAPAVPTATNDCKDGAWQNLVRVDATPFKNQGACVSYVNTGK